MKIISGKRRGARIRFKPNPQLRPTASKVRKAILDIFQGELAGRRVLDLFSGTGALGLEALSAGAAHVTFVEKERPQAKRIRRHLGDLGFRGNSRVLAVDAFRAMAILSEEKTTFDFVWMDPPYGKGLGARALETLAHSPLLHAGSLVLWECHKGEIAPPSVGRLRLIQEKRYGDTKLLFYRAQDGHLTALGD